MGEKENAEKELREAWENLIEKSSLEAEPYEKTITQFMEEAGITRRKAKYYLEKEVEEGRMTKRKIRNENYYRPVL